ncbi:DUF1349 domain-containing protein [Belliella marina]|uniref:DUF1349 domain-containing protein n=1 Tax=Belliella marina TaxID=1644146 RepID=A0ABW4VNE3_9BACT
MKKVWLKMLLVMAVMSSCDNATTDKTESSYEVTVGEACSVKVSGIEFTKSINGAREATTHESDKLIIKSSAEQDNFNDPDGKLSNNSAPVLLTKIDNTKPFTFTAKVTPTFNDVYDAGTLYIYQNPKSWLKFAFEKDERMKTRIVTVRTIGTSDDNNHDIVESENVYMKISSDGKTMGFYYSLDKENWQLVRLFRNDYPEETWIGLGSQSPIGDGSSVAFEECSLTSKSVEDFRMGI